MTQRNGPFNQSITRWINQQSINQSINRLMNDSLDQPINQSINQSIKSSHIHSRLDNVITIYPHLDIINGRLQRLDILLTSVNDPFIDIHTHGLDAYIVDIMSFVKHNHRLPLDLLRDEVGDLRVQQIVIAVDHNVGVQNGMARQEIRAPLFLLSNFLQIVQTKDAVRECLVAAVVIESVVKLARFHWRIAGCSFSHIRSLRTTNRIQKMRRTEEKQTILTELHVINQSINQSTALTRTFIADAVNQAINAARQYEFSVKLPSSSGTFHRPLFHRAVEKPPD